MSGLMVPCEERMALLPQIMLARGKHTIVDPPAGACCLVEAASWLRCAPNPSDRDETVCPTIAVFCRGWNDGIGDDVVRTRLLMPFTARIIGTNTSPADSERRAWMACDWLVRTALPVWLRLAQLDTHANALQACPPIMSAESTPARVIAAARDAASTAARDAASAAAWAAASAAASAAARDAVSAAAWAAASAAARAAAGEALQPTVALLQSSAADLLGRMCDVGRNLEEVRNA